MGTTQKQAVRGSKLFKKKRKDLWAQPQQKLGSDPTTLSSQEAPASRGLELEEATGPLAGGLSTKAPPPILGEGHRGPASCRPPGWSPLASAPQWRRPQPRCPDLSAAMASGGVASRPGGAARRPQEPVKDADSRLGRRGLKQDKSE